ncbi:MAG: 2-oxoacid:acceptor oxidoreductase family protein [bacterium]|nr:2-oxoacid:acceptor oxidoreductase family protein [bacterium]
MLAGTVGRLDCGKERGRLSTVTEIRWHGRGGQGAKTAALLLAEAVSEAGKYVQGFPEYGPERMGAPVAAFNRLSDEPIRLHCHVSNPNIVVILDPTLIKGSSIVEGLTAEGLVLVNTAQDPAQLRSALGLAAGQRVFAVDASHIARETIGLDIPNMPMMGVLLAVAGVLPREQLRAIIQKQLEAKFKGKRDVAEGNLKAIDRAIQEVRGA